MKKLYIILLALVTCHAAAAQAISFKIHAAATYPMLSDVTEEVMFVAATSSPQQERAIIHTNFKQKAGARFGGALVIGVSPKFALETGLQATMVRFQKTKNITFPDQTEANTTGDPQDKQIARDSDGNPLVDANGNYIYTGFGSPFGSFYGRRWSESQSNSETEQQTYQPDPKTGNVTAIYVDIPVTTRYSAHKLLDLKAGISASVLAYSQQHISVSHNDIRFMHPGQEASIEWTSSDDYFRYGKDKSDSGLNKLLLSLTTGITLNVTEHAGLNLDYARYLTPVYKEQLEKHQHKYNLFSAGLSYAF